MGASPLQNRNHGIYVRHQHIRRWHVWPLIVPLTIVFPFIVLWDGLKAMIPEIVEAWKYALYGCQCSSCVNYRHSIADERKGPV